MQISAFALKKRMRLYLKHHIEIARRTTIRANIALLLISNPGAIFHACRYAHVNQVFFHHAALAFALAARIGNNASLPMAGWAWPGNAEHGLLIPDLAAAGACLACGWPLRSRRAGAVALLACFIPAYFGLSLFAESGFLKGKRDIRARVSAALHAVTSSAAATHIHAKEIAEDVAKNIADVGEVGTVKPAKAATVHGCVAILVVAGALVRIHQHAVGFRTLLELFLSFGVARVAVGMPLHGQLAIGALDLLLRRGAAHAQYFVIIAFCLRCQNVLN